MATVLNGNGNLIDEFEEAFTHCLNLFINNDNSENHIKVDKVDTRKKVDQVIVRFEDIARQVEAYFLQKRLLTSELKPDQIVHEDILEMKNALKNKEEIINKHYEKIIKWQNLLAEMHGCVQPPNPITNSVQNNNGQGLDSGMNSTVQQQQKMQQHLFHTNRF